MRPIKLMIAVIDVIAAAAILYVATVVPYRQNLLKKRIETQFAMLQAQTGSSAGNLAVIATMREGIGLVRNALKLSPTDGDLYMELAALYRFMGQNQEAAATYREALRYHRRPEIFANLAEAELASGDIAAATEHYAYVLAFAPEEAAWVPNEMYAAAAIRSRQIIEAIVRR